MCLKLPKSQLLSNVPDQSDRQTALLKLPIDDLESARFMLFDSGTVFRNQVSVGQLLALVIEDLHWSDKVSWHSLASNLLGRFDASIAPIPHYQLGMTLG